MKTLYIIRHAKSSWNFDHLRDFDRPLGVKGRRDVLKMARYLSEHEPTPDLIISSPASRAFYTSLFIADEWGFPEDRILLRQSFYLADAMHILEVIQSQKEASSLAISGHNPGLTDLSNYLTTAYIDNIPTCGVVGIRFRVERWSEISQKSGKQFVFKVPKKL